MEQITYDIATIAAVVAALTGVVKSLGVPGKYAPVVAMLFSAIFVFLPDGATKQGVLMTAVIGLTAAGAYSYVKPDKSSS